MVVDVHGEQNGAIYQEVTLGRSNFAPVSMLSEDSADVLERLINSKHRNHSSHLPPQAYHYDCTAGAGALVLTAGDLVSCEDQRELLTWRFNRSARLRCNDVGAFSQPGHFRLGGEALDNGGQPATMRASSLNSLLGFSTVIFENGRATLTLFVGAIIRGA